MIRRLPQDLLVVKGAAEQALAPIRPVTDATDAKRDFLFTAHRSDASCELPAYYLIYFLLVDLLGFKNLGRFEKISWSVPIDFNGRAFLVEHRKFGVGVFVQDSATDEIAAKEVVGLINAGVDVAAPFFDWLATQAVKSSKINVTNNSRYLLGRFDFFLRGYHEKKAETERRKDEVIRKQISENAWSYSHPSWALNTEANCLALAAIEAFFSWTEHVFVHIGILEGIVKTVESIAKLANADWPTKFRSVIDLSDPESNAFYDKLILIRREHRNFVAHGSFGKQGEAFEFHSSIGAVPVLLPHKNGKRKFSLGARVTSDDAYAIAVIENFLTHLWSGLRAPAKVYVESDLPTIVTMASDGSYTRAMNSIEDMEALVTHLSHRFDQAANMDW